MPSTNSSRKNGKIGKLPEQAGKDDGILGKDHGYKGGRPKKIETDGQAL